MDIPYPQFPSGDRETNHQRERLPREIIIWKKSPSGVAFPPKLSLNDKDLPTFSPPPPPRVDEHEFIYIYVMYPSSKP
jgi:hypothetical protein